MCIRDRWIGSLGRPPRHARTAPQPWPRARSHKGGVLAGRLSIPLGRHLLGPKPPSAGLFLRRSLPMPPSPPRDPPSATSDARKRLPRNLLAVRPARVGVGRIYRFMTVSYTHLRAHETRHDLVCR